MFGFLVVIHALACILLIVVILAQSGRGGGLTEAFSSAESMFGAKTNVVLIRATAVVAVVFLITSLSLAFLSSRMNKSLMATEGIPSEQPQAVGSPVVDEGRASPAPQGQGELSQGTSLSETTPSGDQEKTDTQTVEQDNQQIQEGEPDQQTTESGTSQ